MNQGTDIRAESTNARPVYYVSDRPEAYEVNSEIGHEEARRIAELIAARAGRYFPEVEFRIDSAWHSHRHGMEEVAAYIEERWQAWVAGSGA